MSKHTPGPWRVVKHDKLVVVDDERMTIMCNFPYSLSVEQNMADARLIAAAPELLEALQSIAECCDEDHAARDYASRQTEIRGIARAAIRKATGG